MEWARDAASKRQFEVFAAEASDTLFRTGYLMTGDLKDAEDLVQAGVIDPTKVTRTALQNAASIASLMLTTEAMVCAIVEEDAS